MKCHQTWPWHTLDALCIDTGRLKEVVDELVTTFKKIQIVQYSPIIRRLETVKQGLQAVGFSLIMDCQKLTLHMPSSHRQSDSGLDAGKV